MAIRSLLVLMAGGSLLCARDVAVACHSEGAAASSPALVTVEDAVREAVLGDPGSITWNDIGVSERASLPSPDGKRAAVVLRRGDPEHGTNDGELLLFDLTHSEIPAPLTLAELRSGTNQQPIARVKWLADNERLVFAGTHGDQVAQVYLADTKKRRFTPLTNETRPLVWYDVAPSGDRLVVLMEHEAIRPEDDPACRRQGCLVSATSLFDAEDGTTGGSSALITYDLRNKTEPNVTHSFEFDSPESDYAEVRRCDDELIGGISPDGRFALRACFLKAGAWPDWWRDYVGNAEFRAYLERGNVLVGKHLLLYDLERRAVTRVSDAPYLWSQAAPPIWIDNGARVILTGALQSLSSVSGEERRRRAESWPILLFEPGTGHVTELGSLPSNASRIVSAVWNQAHGTLIIRSSDATGKELERLTIRRRGQRWSLVGDLHAPASPGRVPRWTLSVVQSANDRPVLVGTERVTGKRQVLLDPNSWLSSRRIAHVEHVTWKTRDGRTWRGGLYLPPDYVPGVRYPVVLLTHGFDRDRFSLSGYSRNYVAQPLAAHGMIVLQIAENLRDVVGTPAEWVSAQSGYEAALEYLDGRGLIDTDRVGIQGWSRTGMHVSYTLTHSSHRFAAAAFTSTGGFGLWWYLAQGADRGYETGYGTPPFGEGLDAWRKLAPSFSLERLRTPVFMWEDASVAGLWDWYAGMRRLGVPVEYWYLPDGAHELFQVPQRISMGHLLVDWFRFWLQEEKDCDPRKSAQYERWESLRDRYLHLQSTASKTIESFHIN